MKGLTTIITLCVSLLVFQSPAMAAENLRIGVIDMRAIISNSPQAKAAMDKLKQEFKSREEQNLAVEKSLKEKSEKLQRNGAVMSEAERNKLERDIVTAQRDLQRMQAEYREDAAVRQQEEMKKVLEKINHIVQNIAEKEHYDLIVHVEAAPYATKKINLTDKVIASIKSPA